MTIREEKMQEGRDCFNNLEAYCMQDPGSLNLYKKRDSDYYRYWLDAAANYWESLGSD